MVCIGAQRSQKDSCDLSGKNRTDIDSSRVDKSLCTRTEPKLLNDARFCKKLDPAFLHVLPAFPFIYLVNDWTKKILAGTNPFVIQVNHFTSSCFTSDLEE